MMGETMRTDETEGSAKAERCRLSGCPEYGKHNPKCSRCSGPVMWKDAIGCSHGRTRSCHNCPNNGLGLPVCYAACPGPNSNYQCDGQDIVTLGSLDDEESFVSEHREDKFDIRSGGDSVIDAIQDEPDDPRHAYDNTITETLSNEAETACKVIFSTLMSLDETNLRIFYYLYRDVNPANIAKKLGISKQAVCHRKDLMTRDHRWMRYFVKSLGLKVSYGGGSNRGRIKNSQLMQPDLFVDSVMQSLNRDTRRSRLDNCETDYSSSRKV